LDRQKSQVVLQQRRAVVHTAPDEVEPYIGAGFTVGLPSHSACMGGARIFAAWGSVRAEPTA